MLVALKTSKYAVSESSTLHSLNFQNSITECSGNLYGQNCSKLCGNCLGGAQCHHVNGTCMTGCASGWLGLLCTTGKNAKLQPDFISK